MLHLVHLPVHGYSTMTSRQSNSLVCERNPSTTHGSIVVEYRNWPRYGLRWSGWYCNPAQHELFRPWRGRAGRHNECFAGLQYQPRQRRPYKWSISILPRSQFYKKQGKLAFSTSSTAVRPHRCLRNDAWRREQLATSQLVCDVTINKPRTTSTKANSGFHSQSRLAM